MANCKICKKKVSCGCQLSDGICIACIAKVSSKSTSKIVGQKIVTTTDINTSNNSININLNQ